MGLFGLGRSSSVQLSDHKGHLALYRRLRPIRLRLNNTLVSRLSKKSLFEAARRLGFLRGDTLVFDSEEDSAVLMDYGIYDVRHNERNAIDEYLCDCPPDLESDEMTCLNAMQHATYDVIIVVDVVARVGCHVQSLLTDETRLLVDTGLSKTVTPGTVAAMRLLDFGEFVATSGAAIPLGIVGDGAIDDWQQQFRECFGDGIGDPAPLIRECIGLGLESDIRCEELDTGQHRRNDWFESWAENRAQRNRQPATREARKPMSNRRCRCGSGKMFKNCCGKH